MMDLHAYFGWSLVAAGMSLAVACLFRLSLIAKVAAIFLGFALLAVLFFAGQPLPFYARGMFGEISVPTQVLVLSALAHAVGCCNRFTAPIPRDLAALLVMVFGALNLSALGFVPYDLYAWGYQPRLLLLVAAGLMGYAWWRHPGVAVAWLTGLACFAVSALPSVNLWDAMGDPWLALAGVWHLVIRRVTPRVAAAPKEQTQMMEPVLRIAA